MKLGLPGKRKKKLQMISSSLLFVFVLNTNMFSPTHQSINMPTEVFPQVGAFIVLLLE
jgi:hypothetical protein